MKTSIAVVILFAAAVLAENAAGDGASPAPGEATVPKYEKDKTKSDGIGSEELIGPLNEEAKYGTDSPSNVETGKGGKSGKKSKNRSDDKAKSGDVTGSEHSHHHHQHSPFHQQGTFDMNTMPHSQCPYFITPYMLYHMLMQQFPNEAQFLSQGGDSNSPHPSVVQTIDPPFPRASQDGSTTGDGETGKGKGDGDSKAPLFPSIRELPPVAP